MIVVDASVFNKLFLSEPDRSEAVVLFRQCIESGRPLLAPSLILYEALSVALHYDVPFEVVHDLFSTQRAAGMRLIEPNRSMLLIARRIAGDGSRQAGYPSLQDSIYHAVAIELGGVFVTADRRHVVRAQKHGHIALLSDRSGWGL